VAPVFPLKQPMKLFSEGLHSRVSSVATQSRRAGLPDKNVCSDPVPHDPGLKDGAFGHMPVNPEGEGPYDIEDERLWSERCLDGI
jgi:hypothetical protein